MIKIKLENPAFQFATRAEVDANVTIEFGSDIGYSDALIRMKVIDGDNEYVVIFLGAAPTGKNGSERNDGDG